VDPRLRGDDDYFFSSASRYTFCESGARGLALGDLVDVLHALDHLAPQRVLAGQAAAAVAEADEELAVGAVGIGRARGADAAALVDLFRELGREVGIARAADADALGVAGLGHEALDDAVELDVVVEALLGQQLDALDVLGREVGAQLDEHTAGFQLDDEGVLGVGCLGKRKGGESQEGKGETGDETDHEKSSSC
jgi:hypothetical protein